MITIEVLKEGIERINLAYIERPELDGNYPAMIVQYIISALLIELGQKASDFGFYTDGEYTGYIRLNNKVLYFAPTKSVILDEK